MNWDDMQYLLAIAQAGNLKGAARQLGVDKTTVSRRLRVLERALGQAVVETTGTGVALTEFGLSLHRHAEIMQGEMQAVRAKAQSRQDATLGTVRLTSVPLVINHVLAPALPKLLEASPGLQVELISEARDLSLLRGDADIALRLARPSEGGQLVLARRLGVLDYAAYAVPDAPATMPWIGYDRQMQFLSHAASISAVAEAEGAFPVAVNDAETLFQLACAGYGKTLLPRLVGAREARLVEIPYPLGALPQREIWLMVRRDLRGLERIRAVVAWIDQILSDLPS